MIFLKKLHTKNKQDFIVFSNDKGWEAAVPIDRWHFDRIKLYLESIVESSTPFEIQENNENEEIEDNL